MIGFKAPTVALLHVWTGPFVQRREAGAAAEDVLRGLPSPDRKCSDKRVFREVGRYCCSIWELPLGLEEQRPEKEPVTPSRCIPGAPSPLESPPERPHAGRAGPSGGWELSCLPTHGDTGGGDVISSAKGTCVPLPLDSISSPSTETKVPLPGRCAAQTGAMRPAQREGSRCRCPPAMSAPLFHLSLCLPPCTARTQPSAASSSTPTVWGPLRGGCRPGSLRGPGWGAGPLHG